METTKEGFVFRRKTSNKPDHQKIFQQKNQSNFNEEDFVFKIIAKNPVKLKIEKENNFFKKNLKMNQINKKPIDSQIQTHGSNLKDSKKIEKSSKINFEKKIKNKKDTKKKIDKKYNLEPEKENNFNKNESLIDNTIYNDINEQMGNDIKKKEIKELNESGFIFKTLKKRRTIQMDENLDISTDTEVSQVEETLKLELPKLEEKMKSNEIHKKIKDKNINTLVKECLNFMNIDCKYGQEIMKNCAANYFRDIDYKKEIENVNNKNENIKEELTKWKRIYEDLKNNNEINVELLNDSFEYEEDLENIQLEFNKKAEKLNSLVVRVKHYLSVAKNRADSLLRNIFESMEEEKVDAMFLLKTMSRIGK